MYESLRTLDDGSVATTMANLVANRIYIKKNTPYSFLDRPWMIDIFDDPHRYILLKTARQVSKSTTIGARILTNTEVYAPYSVIYLSPSFRQTASFSHDRLGPTIKDSPHLQVRMDQDCLDNVLEKEFADGSFIYLSYAKDNADRVRGISGDELDLDEIQDMDLDAVEKVVRESLFVSPHKRRLYSGTPKSFSNGIERRWRESDQREWMVRCRRHGPKPYHQKLTRRNVGKTGPICDRCGALLYTPDGLWVRTSTRTAEGKEPYIHGYHLPQIIFPTTETQLAPGKFGFLDWGEFLRDIESVDTDDATVANEKFGESADSAEKPITEDQLRALCVPQMRMPTQYADYMLGEYTFAGIDWGEGKAPTVLAIGQFSPKNPKKFRLLFARKYSGRDARPEVCVPDILRLCEAFRVKRAHADWGGGFGQNSRLHEARGDEFLSTNYWSSSISGKNIAFDENLNRFVLNKSITFTRFFEALKRGGIEVAMCWEDFQNFGKDVLAEFREQRKNGDPYFDHHPNEPDDFLHAFVYCWLIACWIRYSADFVDNARVSAKSGTLHQPTVGW